MKSLVKICIGISFLFFIGYFVCCYQSLYVSLSSWTFWSMLVLFASTIGLLLYLVIKGILEFHIDEESKFTMCTTISFFTTIISYVSKIVNDAPSPKHFEYIFISSLILGVALGMIVWLALIFVECYKESKASKDKTMMEIFKERKICRKTKFAFLVLITTLVLMSLL